eukprot:8628191-Pyramimonas_sp.AAC.1
MNCVCDVFPLLNRVAIHDGADRRGAPACLAACSVSSLAAFMFASAVLTGPPARTSERRCAAL